MWMWCNGRTTVFLNTFHIRYISDAHAKYMFVDAVFVKVVRRFFRLFPGSKQLLCVFILLDTWRVVRFTQPRDQVPDHCDNFRVKTLCVSVRNVRSYLTCCALGNLCCWVAMRRWRTAAPGWTRYGVDGFLGRRRFRTGLRKIVTWCDRRVASQWRLSQIAPETAFIGAQRKSPFEKGIFLCEPVFANDLKINKDVTTRVKAFIWGVERRQCFLCFFLVLLLKLLKCTSIVKTTAAWCGILIYASLLSFICILIDNNNNYVRYFLLEVKIKRSSA